MGERGRRAGRGVGGPWREDEASWMIGWMKCY